MNLGVGVMYRVIDCKGLLEELYEKKHRFGSVSLTIEFDIKDDLQDEESKNFTVTFSNGEIQRFPEQAVDPVV